MTRRRETRRAALTTVLGILLLAGCGGDPEQERVGLLTSDPGASLKSNSDVFLAQIGEKTDWTVVDTPETEVGTATEDLVGATFYSEGCHLGLLKVVMADKEAKETPFRFVFVSIPDSGTWILRRVGVIDENDQVQPFSGDMDVFDKISANQGRHPDHPDYVGP